MKILDPMSAEARAEIKTNIQSHREVLRELLSTSAEMARKYLLFTNAGAAVALMAFMGNNEYVRSSPVAWASLGLFTLGVIACGVLAATDYHNQLGAFQLWLRDSGRFFRNDLDLDALYEALNSNDKKKSPRPVVASYVAFACFVAGASISIISFLVHRPAALSAEQLFAEQTSCGASARDWFSKLHAKEPPAITETMDYESHYNRKLNRCFAVLREGHTDFVSTQLFDVNENGSIGIYMQFLRDKQPERCETERTRCHSDKEWSAWLEPYLED